MARSIASRLRQLHDVLRQTEQIYIVMVSVVIGLLGGFSAVGFRLLIQLLNRVFWHQGQYTISYLYGLPVWWKLLAPTVGGAMVGFIVYRFAREARGHGVPEVMEAVAVSGGRIRPRVVVAKMFASGVCIASGGSVGREGPIVQIGSALGSTLGQWLDIDHQRLRTLVGCGAAAGIAGTFNAPVAGALFAVEIILGDFGVTQFSPIVISSVAATVVSQHFLGDFPAFIIPSYSLLHAYELFAYAALGILAGLAALAFIRALYGTEDLFDRIKLHPIIKGSIGGAIVGTIGIWVPHIFGVGYEAINDALNGTMLWYFMVALVLAKIIAVSVTIGSGGSGGIFAPSLFIGAMLGGAIGTVVHSLWPATTAGPGAYALVGMGAVVAAGTHAPITAILIIFELTNEYKIILPLMISCIIATLISTRVQRSSIYTLKLLRRGIDIHKGRAVNVLEGIPVQDVVRMDALTVSPEAHIGSVVAKLIDHPGTTLFVTTEDDELEGVIRAEQIRPIMTEASSLDALLIAQDVMVEGEYPKIGLGDSLANVMRHMGAYRGEIPVLEEGRLVGVIWPNDVLERYNTEVFKRDMAHSMVSAVSPDSNSEFVPATKDAIVAEVKIPTRFVGKTIKELDIRKSFGVSVLMIKQVAPDGNEQLKPTPDADYTFGHGDIVLVMGTNEGLRRLRTGIPRGKQ